MRCSEIPLEGCIFFMNRKFDSRSRNRSRSTGVDRERFGRSRSTGAERERFGRSRSTGVERERLGGSRSTAAKRERIRKYLFMRRSNDSESLSALKSNMGAREIWFFMVTDYLCGTHPSNEKISRLTLQNSLRVILDLQKVIASLWCTQISKSIPIEKVTSSSSFCNETEKVEIFMKNWLFMKFV